MMSILPYTHIAARCACPARGCRWPGEGPGTPAAAESNNLPVTVQIWDVMGKQFYNAQTNFAGNTAAIHLNNIPPGLYILKITDSKGGIFNYKFIVQ